MKSSNKQPWHSTGLARVLSKRGICSRSEAFEMVRAGRVTVNGVIVRDPMSSVPERARLEVDGARKARKQEPAYVMLNKPRGLITSSADEPGRETVTSCLANSGLPPLAAVGRMDKATEGLLLLTDDTEWAAKITDRSKPLDNTYHVEIETVADEALLQRMIEGVEDKGERLTAKAVRLLRGDEKNSWVEIVLDEGRNHHIRRFLDALGVSVLRLIRISIGALALGEVGKGKWRRLSHQEVEALR